MQEEWLRLQKIIIGFLFSSGDASALQRARTSVSGRNFTGKYGEFWRNLIKYYDRHQCMLTLPILRDSARAKRWDEQKLMEYEQVLYDCQEAAENIQPGDFSYYLDRMVDVYRQTMFVESMSSGMKLLQEKGFVPARNAVLESLSKIDEGGISYTSETDLHTGVEDFIRNVSEAKVQHALAVRFGLPQLDDIVLGLRRGDFCLVSAFAGVGKTSFCVNTAVDVAFAQKKNVVYITTETTKEGGLLRRIFARISRLPLFDTPVSSVDMKSGKLTPEQNQTLLQIKEHIKRGDVGRFKVVQAPPDITLGWLRGRLLQYEADFPLDLVILDDLRNVHPSRRRNSEWEEFNDLLKGAKALARTHAGKGVPLVSPYQISREGEKSRLSGDSKRYTLTALSSSSEAERSPDIVIAEVREGDEQDSLVLHILKNRDGRANVEVKVRVEFDFQLFYEVEGGEFGFNG